METTKQSAQSSDDIPYLTTEQFAQRQGIKPSTVRHRLCVTGSYFGVVPKKLANRLLVWPDVQIEA